MAEPLASVVIPTLNGGQRFRRCIEAVAGQKVGGGIEIIVVDSGSTDGTDRVAEDHAEVIRIKGEDFNHGLTRNLGIEKARAKVVALLVQDAVPGPGWLMPLVEAVREPGVAGAYSRQVPRPDCPPFIKARLTRWSAGGSGRLVKKVSGEDELMSMSFPERVGLLSFDNVSSAIDREVWESHRFPARRFGEDAAWSKEVMLSGHSIVYEPGSVVEHSHHNSLWYEFKRVYLDHRNWREVAGGALFNNPIEVFQASVNGVFERWEELSDVSGFEKAYWMAYAVPWSFSQNLAQFLGARSYKAAMRLSWWKKVDEFMSKGV